MSVEANQFSLFSKRRFLPLFITQALGAFNDNAFKQALVILVTFVLAQSQGINAAMFINVAAAAFILPFFLFSATAGQIADRYDKAVLTRRIKVAEIVIMVLAGIGFALQSPYWLLGVLFLLGAQSTFFGPIKYGILPQHLQKEELVAGNALIESGTLIAILLGTLFGGLLITASNGVPIVAVSVFALAIVGWMASRSIPAAPPPDPDLKVDYNFVRATYRMTRSATSNRDIFLCILGLSWFWLMGSVFLTQLPEFTRSVLGANETVSNLFIAIFTIGVAAGSLLNNRLLRGAVSARYVPLAGLGVSLFGIDLALVKGLGQLTDPKDLMGVASFVNTNGSWRIMFDLFALAVCGGLFSVPLYALIQRMSPPERVSRNIAVNNIINALFMAVAAGTIAVLVSIGWTIPAILLGVAILNIAVALYAVKLLPAEVIANIGRFIFRLIYRVEVKGWENYRAAGRKAVIVANHTSFLDGPMLACFLPDKPSFAINTAQAEHWLVRPFLSLFKLLPVDPRNPMAIKSLVREVKDGNKCMIFPEGRITTTGALMKVYDGPATIAHLADAPLLPIRISGAQHSFFSRVRGILPHRWFPKVTITILEPQKLEVPENLKGGALRQHLSDELYDMMTEMMFQTSPKDRTLFSALLDAKRTFGGKSPVLEDINFEPISYSRLITGSFVLGRKMTAMTPDEKHIGLLLPNANGAAVSFFGLHAFGRTPAMLNFSAGAKNMTSACLAAQVKTIFTSRVFIEAGNLEDQMAELGKHVRLIYLEDIRDEIGGVQKLIGFVSTWFGGLAYRFTSGGATPEDAAAILFTSGSEGSPKGVVLSHKNLNANCHQIAARIDFSPRDVVFNALPVFHAFGLTGGFLLPLLYGVRIFLYPSPLHYRAVPELIYDTNATIMFGTDTFLAGYARMANPYDFYSMRYVVAGAEAVKEETRKVWMEKFGLRILEGYGATETAPVLALNTPMHNKPGSVGRLLPGIKHRLETVEGIEEGGKLVVQGPNVMSGYLRDTAPGVLEVLDGGWYDTGDIVSEDEHGFISIKGRAKRFAKIAGEMVSLPAVEKAVNGFWPKQEHIVVKLPDAKKGEQLVLITTRKGLARKDLTDMGKKSGLAELWVPRQIVEVDEIPLLGSGKTDYVSAEKLAVDTL
ncbi:MAG: acyl-[ACP]--phospholipid O-acyltransferase [Hyphomicrobiales bacterium]